MTRSEFESRAGIGKTKFFALLQDRAVQVALDYEPSGPAGRATMNRPKALEFIKALRAQAQASHANRLARLGAHLIRECPECKAQITRKAGTCPHCESTVPAATNTPPRGRPCANCGRRITRKACTCRHCGTPAWATTEP